MRTNHVPNLTVEQTLVEVKLGDAALKEMTSISNYLNHQYVCLTVE